mmetsp:Transcript_57589/g.187105  ORF Transcript_57589/g.187105 Transcript_57589/m.187105 type:complete len:244 (-) Transcript_57589:273-1004(-)
MSGRTPISGSTPMSGAVINCFYSTTSTRATSAHHSDRSVGSGFNLLRTTSMNGSGSPLLTALSSADPGRIPRHLEWSNNLKQHFSATCSLLNNHPASRILTPSPKSPPRPFDRSFNSCSYGRSPTSPPGPASSRSSSSKSELGRRCSAMEHPMAGTNTEGEFKRVCPWKNSRTTSAPKASVTKNMRASNEAVTDGDSKTFVGRRKRCAAEAKARTVRLSFKTYSETMVTWDTSDKYIATSQSG